MQKATDLKKSLLQWVRDLRKNPDKLHVFIDRGNVASRAGKSLSFEYRYTCTVLITDFTGSPDVLVVPLLAWIEKNQPDLLQAPDKNDKLIALQAEIIDHDRYDIEIKIDLSERVQVKGVTGGYECNHLGEPQLPDELSGTTGWSLFAGSDIEALSQ